MFINIYKYNTNINSIILINKPKILLLFILVELHILIRLLKRIIKAPANGTNIIINNINLTSIIHIKF